MFRKQEIMERPGNATGCIENSSGHHFWRGPPCWNRPFMMVDRVSLKSCQHRYRDSCFIGTENPGSERGNNLHKFTHSHWRRRTFTHAHWRRRKFTHSYWRRKKFTHSHWRRRKQVGSERLPGTGFLLLQLHLVFSA